ncbi:hypothetical protein CEUSTIGMA_g844.t1 [Chlamydomonas eustigma]|uniref:Guanylate cyclase domain-containing protein n=1 Tax=Chlamydomonas eustigma TaxID=1157962 RepID=A0A250WRH1_9CHLO|nr:hypothetical protein CEUSTIGMA_g844.t1 [Chlamydomonas eustigma]|eukprot:GAX73391.1 hypothetical protein CEUSTIGMA_g844.t1 [Chlamydomonas eustigma]
MVNCFLAHCFLPPSKTAEQSPPNIVKDSKHESDRYLAGSSVTEMSEPVASVPTEPLSSEINTSVFRASPQSLPSSSIPSLWAKEYMRSPHQHPPPFPLMQLSQQESIRPFALINLYPAICALSKSTLTTDDVDNAHADIILQVDGLGHLRSICQRDIDPHAHDASFLSYFSVASLYPSDDGIRQMTAEEYTTQILKINSQDPRLGLMLAMGCMALQNKQRYSETFEIAKTDGHNGINMAFDFNRLQIQTVLWEDKTIGRPPQPALLVRHLQATAMIGDDASPQHTQSLQATKQYFASVHTSPSTPAPALPLSPIVSRGTAPTPPLSPLSPPPISVQLSLVDQVPAMVTLCCLQGHVLYQNLNSLQYYGDRRIPVSINSSSASLLSLLLGPTMAAEVLQALTSQQLPSNSPSSPVMEPPSNSPSSPVMEPPSAASVQSANTTVTACAPQRGVGIQLPLQWKKVVIVPPPMSGESNQQTASASMPPAALSDAHEAVPSSLSKAFLTTSHDHDGHRLDTKHTMPLLLDALKDIGSGSKSVGLDRNATVTSSTIEQDSSQQQQQQQRWQTLRTSFQFPNVHTASESSFYQGTCPPFPVKQSSSAEPGSNMNNPDHGFIAEDPVHEDNCKVPDSAPPASVSTQPASLPCFRRSASLARSFLATMDEIMVVPEQVLPEPAACTAGYRMEQDGQQTGFLAAASLIEISSNMAIESPSTSSSSSSSSSFALKVAPGAQLLPLASKQYQSVFHQGPSAADLTAPKRIQHHSAGQDSNLVLDRSTAGDLYATQGATIAVAAAHEDGENGPKDDSSPLSKFQLTRSMMAFKQMKAAAAAAAAAPTGAMKGNSSISGARQRRPPNRNMTMAVLSHKASSSSPKNVPQLFGRQNSSLLGERGVESSNCALQAEPRHQHLLSSSSYLDLYSGSMKCLPPSHSAKLPLQPPLFAKAHLLRYASDLTTLGETLPIDGSHLVTHFVPSPGNNESIKANDTPMKQSATSVSSSQQHAGGDDFKLMGQAVGHVMHSSAFTASAADEKDTLQRDLEAVAKNGKSSPGLPGPLVTRSSNDAHYNQSHLEDSRLSLCVGRSGEVRFSEDMAVLLRGTVLQTEMLDSSTPQLLSMAVTATGSESTTAEPINTSAPLHHTPSLQNEVSPVVNSTSSPLEKSSPSMCDDSHEGGAESKKGARMPPRNNIPSQSASDLTATVSLATIRAIPRSRSETNLSSAPEAFRTQWQDPCSNPLPRASRLSHASAPFLRTSSNHSKIAATNLSVKQLVQTLLRSRSSFSITTASERNSQNALLAEEHEHEQPMACWHEVQAQLIDDPFHAGDLAILLVQTDVTARMQMETTLADMSEGQLSLLSTIFPRHVVEHLSLTDLSALPSHFGSLARSHDDVTILFLDIVGFTAMSQKVSPSSILVFLNQLFTMFDFLADLHEVQKVDTAGDCYIAAAGISYTRDNNGFFEVRSGASNADAAANAQRMFAFSQDVLRCAREVLMPHNGLPVSVRVGLHTGSCVSGLVGTKVPKFSLFGDAINTASRMESTGVEGCIQASSSTFKLLSQSPSIIHPEGGLGPQSETNPSWDFNASCWRATGGIEVKGKGCMETYVWRPSEKEFYDRPAPGVVQEVLNIVRHDHSSAQTRRSSALESHDLGLPNQQMTADNQHVIALQARTAEAMDSVLPEINTPAFAAENMVLDKALPRVEVKGLEITQHCNAVGVEGRELTGQDTALSQRNVTPRVSIQGSVDSQRERSSHDSSTPGTSVPKYLLNYGLRLMLQNIQSHNPLHQNPQSHLKRKGQADLTADVADPLKIACWSEEERRAGAVPLQTCSQDLPGSAPESKGLMYCRSPSGSRSLRERASRVLGRVSSLTSSPRRASLVDVGVGIAWEASRLRPHDRVMAVRASYGSRCSSSGTVRSHEGGGRGGVDSDSEMMMKL